MKGAVFHNGKEISEHNLSFCFPRGQQEITQTEPGARVRKLSCDFCVGFGASLTALFDVSPAFVLQDPCAIGAPFVCSVLSSPPPSLDLPCQMDFDCLYQEIKHCSLSLDAVFVVPGLE